MSDPTDPTEVVDTTDGTGSSDMASPLAPLDAIGEAFFGERYAADRRRAQQLADARHGADLARIDIELEAFRRQCDADVQIAQARAAAARGRAIERHVIAYGIGMLCVTAAAVLGVIAWVLAIWVVTS